MLPFQTVLQSKEIVVSHFMFFFFLSVFTEVFCCVAERSRRAYSWYHAASRQDVDDWLNFMLSQKNLWPTFTTSSTSPRSHRNLTTIHRCCESLQISLADLPSALTCVSVACVLVGFVLLVSFFRGNLISIILFQLLTNHVSH